MVLLDSKTKYILDFIYPCFLLIIQYIEGKNTFMRFEIA